MEKGAFVISSPYLVMLLFMQPRIKCGSEAPGGRNSPTLPSKKNLLSIYLTITQESAVYCCRFETICENFVFIQLAAVEKSLQPSMKQEPHHYKAPDDTTKEVAR